MSERLCRAQQPTVRAVAGTLDVAFVAALVILLAWPDVALPRRYIEGFSQLGVLENSGTMRDLPVFQTRRMERAAQVVDRFLQSECCAYATSGGALQGP